MKTPKIPNLERRLIEFSNNLDQETFNRYTALLNYLVKAKKYSVVEIKFYVKQPIKLMLNTEIQVIKPDIKYADPETPMKFRLYKINSEINQLIAHVDYLILTPENNRGWYVCFSSDDWDAPPEHYWEYNENDSWDSEVRKQIKACKGNMEEFDCHEDLVNYLKTQNLIRGNYATRI